MGIPGLVVFQEFDDQSKTLQGVHISIFTRAPASMLHLLNAGFSEQVNRMGHLIDIEGYMVDPWPVFFQEFPPGTGPFKRFNEFNGNIVKLEESQPGRCIT